MDRRHERANQRQVELVSRRQEEAVRKMNLPDGDRHRDRQGQGREKGKGAEHEHQAAGELDDADEQRQWHRWVEAELREAGSRPFDPRTSPEAEQFLRAVRDEGLVGEIWRAEYRWDRWRPEPMRRWRSQPIPQTIQEASSNRFRP